MLSRRYSSLKPLVIIAVVLSLLLSLQLYFGVSKQYARNRAKRVFSYARQIWKNHEQQNETTNANLQCSTKGHHFEGRRRVITEVKDLNVSLEIPSGEWKPRDCISEQKVAIIIPYREREDHLKLLLYQLHPMLQRQKLHYKVFVIEQNGTELFNRAKLFNVGFVIAQRTFKPDCIIFHDVDLVPEDDRNIYNCSDSPKHMSWSMNEHDYKLVYPELVGGVLALKPKVFYNLNGYSNLYFGWGAEDDDFYWRLHHKNFTVNRPSGDVARYTQISHKKREEEHDYKIRVDRYHAQRDVDLSAKDGLSTLDFKLLSTEDRNLDTKALVDLGKPPPREELLHTN